MGFRGHSPITLLTFAAGGAAFAGVGGRARGRAAREGAGEESASVPGTGAAYTNNGRVLDLGGGVVFTVGEGRFDARLTCGVLFGSDNVGGQATVALGYSFRGERPLRARDCGVR